MDPVQYDFKFYIGTNRFAASASKFDIEPAQSASYDNYFYYGISEDLSDINLAEEREDKLVSSINNRSNQFWVRRSGEYLIAREVLIDME